MSQLLAINLTTIYIAAWWPKTQESPYLNSYYRLYKNTLIDTLLLTSTI